MYVYIGVCKSFNPFFFKRYNFSCNCLVLVYLERQLLHDRSIDDNFAKFTSTILSRLCSLCNSYKQLYKILASLSCANATLCWINPLPGSLNRSLSVALYEARSGTRLYELNSYERGIFPYQWSRKIDLRRSHTRGIYWNSRMAIPE